MKNSHYYGSLFAVLFSVGTVNATNITVTPNSLTDCPAVGSATHCALEYRYNADGSVDTLLDPTISSTDGTEDTLIGVLNNSGHTLNSLSLTGAGVSGLGIFDFDGDGESTIPNPAPGTGNADTYFGQYFNAANALLGTVTFSGISTAAKTNDTGTVDFAGLVNGGRAWFVLEDQISFTAPPVVNPPVTGNVPEPASIALLSLGLVILSVRYRRNNLN